MRSKSIFKKKKVRLFEAYISKIIRKISERNGITSNSKQQLNSVICLIASIISNMSIKLTEISQKKTLSTKEIQNTLKIILPSKLLEKAVSRGECAINMYKGNTAVYKGISRQKKAGIIFPPSVTEKYLRNFGCSTILVTNNSPVYLAAVLEYLTTIILKKAVLIAHENKHKRITIRDLELGMKTDLNLRVFFNTNNISFLGGGVVPYIHPILLIKKPKKRIKALNIRPSKKTHRFRPGTVSLRQIRKFQKTSNNLTITRSSFEKLVRTFVNDIKIGKSVFIVMQYFIEQKLIELLQVANFAAIHAGRVKLTSLDIKFVTAIVGKSINPYEKQTL